MKLLNSLVLCSALSVQNVLAASCSHGKLFVSDDNNTNIYVFDVSTGALEDLTPEYTITDAPGKAGLNMKATSSFTEIGVMFRGSEELGYTDGVVSFLDTGARTEMHGDHYDLTWETPSFIENAGFECARVIHYTPHDDRIALFCDGTYGDEEAGIEPVNSTIWIVDETKFGSTTESAVIYTKTLQGSHHGAAAPVDDGHIMYSLATPDRINRTPGVGVTQALPDTFVVEDYEGNLLHSIDDTSNPDTSCVGFHGEWAHDNQFALACNADHGGILRVDYDETAGTYTSRALSYPAAHNESRTGSFTGHDNAHHVVGNFAGPEAFFLMAFEPDDMELTENQLLPLPARQCAFAYEKGAAETVLVFLPTGSFHVFQYHDSAWEQKAEVQVVTNMTECSEVLFVPGVGQAFVFEKNNQPFDAAVAGAPEEVICGRKVEQHTEEGGEDHNHEHEGDEAKDDGDTDVTASEANEVSGARGVVLFYQILLAVSALMTVL
ncbi:expressed unknown protein [Seminavis robusta]|uniref:Uncharacterized protein n=1 Tax=Seminavis robusta TaxID=568900 RepID=A0A9N8ECA4_9STRA|nr:expressed unknown protein [Seminavis robusta]|eukprot:Sro963_g225270.1 n/a (493) ;mRNA; r:10502-12057